MPVEVLLDRLQKVKRVSSGRWMACCPAHDDKNPSLSVTEIDDGRILVYCHTGCGGADVMESVGLTLSDLYPEGSIKDHMFGGTPGFRKKAIKDMDQLASDETFLAICDASRKDGNRQSAKTLQREREAFLRVQKNKPARLAGH